MATINIPNDIILPIPETQKEAELYRAITEYITQLRQTLVEIESKLP
jgi:hypothetical protein